MKSKFLPTRPLLAFVLVILLGSIGLSGCAGSPDEAAGLAMASMKDMPQEVKEAPVMVQEAYQFAVANPDVVKQFPCYCGCGKMGHTSNYSCYVSGVDEAGSLTYDTHALGCSICVDITQDVMRLMKEKKDIPEIQNAITDTYSKYGPSNMAGSGS